MKDKKDSEAHLRIAEVRSGSNLRAHEKRQVITDEIIGDLKRKGTLFNTRLGYFYFEQKPIAKLYPVCSDSIELAALISDRYGINRAERREYEHILESLKVECHQRGQSVPVHRLAHYDSGSGRLYVSRFDGWVYRLNGRSIIEVPNGTDGVFFWDEPNWQQSGYIWKVGGSWYGRWRDNVVEGDRIVRKQRSAKLADVCDRYRTKADVRSLLAEKLRPINEGTARPESTQSVAQYVERHYLPFVEENFKPSTRSGYNSMWEMYLASRLREIALRDFRTVDAARLLAEVHRAHSIGRTTLKHIKSFLSGVFTYAKNQGVLDGVHPIRDATIPRSARVPSETHAATPDDVLAILEALRAAGEMKARAAVALMFFAGLRPGEARGANWEYFDGKKLTVRQSVWHTYRTSPKTSSSAKPVPIIEPLTSILAELRAADGNPSSGPILRGPSGKPLDLHNLGNRVVIPTLRKADIAWHGWYSLRRGVATAVTALSTDSLAAKGLLRHSSVSTTERHYIKDVPESTLQAMKRLESLCKERAITGDPKPN